MLAAKTPILGILIAVLVLIGENVGAMAYVARAQQLANADDVAQAIQDAVHRKAVLDNASIEAKQIATR